MPIESLERGLDVVPDQGIVVCIRCMNVGESPKCIAPTNIRARGINILDKCEEGFDGFRFLRGSGVETNIEMSSVESAVNARSPNVEAWNDGNGAKRRSSSHTEGASRWTAFMAAKGESK